jgi:hypothetical protein
MACGGVLPRTGSTGFQLTDSQVIDCHFGLWAEATCGYAAHLIARNRFVTTQPGVMDAFDYDNGNDDGLLSCTRPSTAALRRQMRNQIIGNTVINSCKLGIAVARMGGFLIQDNYVVSPSPKMRDCSYKWCDSTGGNSIHIEHESYDIEISNNRIVQGGNTNNSSVSVGIWVADSSNVRVTGNNVQLANSTRDCIQFAAGFCTNPKPNHQGAHHDDCTARVNLTVINNTVSGCRDGVNIWGNGTVGIVSVLISHNSIKEQWLAGITIGSTSQVTIATNEIQDAPIPVLIHSASDQVTVRDNCFEAMGSCNITYQGNSTSATTQNNTCTALRS